MRGKKKGRAMAMDASTRKTGDDVVVAVQGRVDISSSLQLRNELTEASGGHTVD